VELETPPSRSSVRDEAREMQGLFGDYYLPKGLAVVLGQECRWGEWEAHPRERRERG